MASQFKNGRCAASSGSLCRLRRLRRRADCRDVRPSFGRARLRTPAGLPCLHTHGVAAPLDAPAPHFPGRRGGGSPGVGWAGEGGGGGRRLQLQIPSSAPSAVCRETLVLAVGAGLNPPAWAVPAAPAKQEGGLRPAPTDKQNHGFRRLFGRTGWRSNIE